MKFSTERYKIHYLLSSTFIIQDAFRKEREFFNFAGLESPIVNFCYYVGIHAPEV